MYRLNIDSPRRGAVVEFLAPSLDAAEGYALSVAQSSEWNRARCALTLRIPHSPDLLRRRDSAHRGEWYWFHLGARLPVGQDLLPASTLKAWGADGL